MKTIGIAAWDQDSAACLLIDGAVRAAAREERFTRVKRAGGFPIGALAFCLDEAYVDSAADIDEIVCFSASAAAGVEDAIQRALPAFRGRIVHTSNPFLVDINARDPLGPAYTSDEIRE